MEKESKIIEMFVSGLSVCLSVCVISAQRLMKFYIASTQIKKKGEKK